MLDIELWQRQKKALRLNFTELSEKSGVSISNLKDIFRGVNLNPRIETISAIESALEITDGITQEERNAGWINVKKISISPDEEDLIYYFRELGRIYGKDMQQAQLAMLKNLVEAKK